MSSPMRDRDGNIIPGSKPINTGLMPSDPFAGKTISTGVMPADPGLIPGSVPYRPITTPPGGLLASAVGTPQNPSPPIDPSRQMEDDSVIGQMNAITDSGSQYIQQAEAAGVRTAQRRGLINSSVAAGASRGAAINAAAPLAMQEAQQRAQRNLTRLDAGFQDARLDRSIASNERMQGIDIASREGMQTQALAAESERLGRQLTAQEQAQVREITNAQFMQGRDLENRTSLTTLELRSREGMQSQALAAESERLGRQLSAAEAENVRNIASQQFMQGRDISSREGMLGTEIQSRETMQREEMASLLQRLGLTNEAENLRANLSAATQVQVATLNNLSQQQQASLQYYASMSGNYLQAAASVWNNENMPAPARQAAIDQFASVLTSGINMPAALYGTNLNWGTGGGGMPAPGSRVTEGPGMTGGGYGGFGATVPAGIAPPVSPNSIATMRSDGIAGNAQAAATSYNQWAVANGLPPIPVEETPREQGGYFGSGGMGAYSGIGLLGRAFG